MRAIFIFIFLTIHPYQEEQLPKLGPAISDETFFAQDPFLAKALADISSDLVIKANNRELAYILIRLLLVLTQATLKTDEPQFMPWLLYFLRSLHKQIQQLEFKMSKEQIALTSLPKLASDIMQLVESKGRIVMADIISYTGAPRSTIKNS